MRSGGRSNEIHRNKIKQKNDNKPNTVEIYAFFTLPSHAAFYDLDNLSKIIGEYYQK